MNCLLLCLYISSGMILGLSQPRFVPHLIGSRSQFPFGLSLSTFLEHFVLEQLNWLGRLVPGCSAYCQPQRPTSFMGDNVPGSESPTASAVLYFRSEEGGVKKTETKRPTIAPDQTLVAKLPKRRLRAGTKYTTVRRLQSCMVQNDRRRRVHYSRFRTWPRRAIHQGQ